MSWYVYIVKCADNSLYTGISTNLERRVQEHNMDNRRGAKSLRGRRPVKLVYYEIFDSKLKAAKREKTIKSWTRKYKLRLIEGFNPKKGLPSKDSPGTFEGP